jgi:hypothetical protein
MKPPPEKPLPRHLKLQGWSESDEDAPEGVVVEVMYSPDKLISRGLAKAKAWRSANGWRRPSGRPLEGDVFCWRPLGE